MKKVMMCIAACSLLLASCSQEEINKNIDSKAIGFRNLNDRITKSANESSDDYAVFAVRSDANNVWYMYNVEVNGVNNSYSPLRYWPTGSATVNFYAFAPYNGSVELDSSDNPNDQLDLVYTVPADANEDFTIARPVIGARSTESSSTVSLDFSHMLSKITVTAKLTDELVEAGYTISFDSTMLSVASNQGETNLTTQAVLEAQGDSAVYQGAKSYMIIPQKAEGSKIQLRNVTIQHNGVNYWTGHMNTYTVTATNVDENKFKANTHYMLSFTVDSGSNNESGGPVFGSAIRFSSSYAATWEDPTTIGLP